MQDTDIISNIDIIINSPYTESLFHLDSLYDVFGNPHLHFNAPVTVPVYDAEMNAMLIEEGERFLVGGVTLEEAIKNMMHRGHEIMATVR